MGERQAVTPTKPLPELTDLEADFLRLLPVDSLSQGMQGASFVHLGRDLKCEPEKVVRSLKAKGVGIVVYDTGWCFLPSAESSRLRPLIDPEPDLSVHSRRFARSYGDHEWRQSTLWRSRRNYHGQARDDV